MKRLLCVKLVTAAGCLLTLSVIVFQYRANSPCESTVSVNPVNTNPSSDWFKFVPKHYFTQCAELFSNATEAANFQMSDDFHSGINEFLDAVDKTADDVEGHSFNHKKYAKALHYLAKELDFVKTVCETGFNAGHSTFNFLAAKPSITLHSFDIGRWNYTRPMAAYLKRKYGNRFHIHLGDSTRTLPAFVAGNSGRIVCDLIHVDGGHNGRVPLRDLENFSRLANLENNIVVADNTELPAVRWAWIKTVDSGIIKPLFGCHQWDGSYPADMAVGMFVKRHRTLTLETLVEIVRVIRESAESQTADT